MKWTSICFFLTLTGFLSAAERPNILFCFADDWGRYASVWAEHEAKAGPNTVIETPNIDRVAREGTFFRNAFVNSPSCTPCRSSLLSGRYFFNTGRGAILNGAEWDASIPSWPLLLRDAGYHIGKSYKVWSPGQPVDAPFGEQQYAFQSAGNAPNNFSEEVTKRITEGSSLEAAREAIYAQVQGNFEAFLAARKDGKPWAYWFGPTNTHRSWIKGSGQALWNIDPDSLKGKMPEYLPDVPEVREDVADYLGECQAYDAYIGVLLKKLEERGELENTIIVISGDHGFPGVPDGKCNLYDAGCGVSLVVKVPGGKAGRVVTDYTTLMDLMPTFLEAASVPLPEGLDAKSLWPVLTSTESGQIDPARTSVMVGRERHVGMAREGNLPYPMRALRTDDFLYIRNYAPERWPMGAPNQVTETSAPTQEELENDTFVAFADMDASPTKAWLVEHRHDPKWLGLYQRAFGKRPAEELYDLKNDPEQLVNVAENSDYRIVRMSLDETLKQALTEVHDPRVVEDGKRFETPPFTDATPQKKGVGNKKKQATKTTPVPAVK